MNTGLLTQHAPRNTRHVFRVPCCVLPDEELTR